MFYYDAESSPEGNANVRRVCNNNQCGGVFYVTYNAQWFRCPHCQHNQ
ncbi:MAG TPA: hypothetical protein VFC72_07235 [Corynebacterium sp.]|nr:hypothetical protein [Corynebacterium sp.]